MDNVTWLLFLIITCSWPGSSSYSSESPTNEAGDFVKDNNCGLVPKRESDEVEEMTPEVMGGEPAVHAWPWLVKMGPTFLEETVDNNGNKQQKQKRIQCAGVIIDEVNLLTAAHCVRSKQKLPLESVELYLYKTDEKDGQKFIRVTPENVIIYYHSLYFPWSEDGYDLALLHLPWPLQFGKRAEANLQKVCLPTKSTFADKKQINRCVVAGWGRTGPNKPYSKTLMQADVKVWSDLACKKSGHDSKRLICVGQRNPITTTCKGDSGGGLWCDVSGRWVLRGIVSFGVGGCRTADPNKPGLLVRVDAFGKWIKWNKKNQTKRTATSRPGLNLNDSQKLSRTTKRPSKRLPFFGFLARTADMDVSTSDEMTTTSIVTTMTTPAETKSLKTTSIRTRTTIPMDEAYPLIEYID